MIGDSTNADTAHDEQWMPVSDLMTLLMLIFMFIAVLFVRSVVDQENVFQQECDKIYLVLKDEFDDDFERWEADLLRDLTIRFRNPDILFPAGSYEIPERGREILSSFFPRYMDRISVFDDDIREIRIEGHTSSEYIGAQSEREAYLKNMELSQSRTRAVLNHILGLPEANTYISWARARILANGLSSSKLLNGKGKLVDELGGEEDKDLSRRVEFRLLTTSCQKAGVSLYANSN